MPLQMRLPKRGFKNPNRVAYVPINLGRLQAIVEKYQLETIDPAVLAARGVVGKSDRIKILGGGELTAKVSVSAHACSSAAKEVIEKLGGSVHLL